MMNLSDDVLHGAQEIASFLGTNRKKIYDLAARRALPVFKMGETVCARKSTLLTWIQTQEQRGASANG